MSRLATCAGRFMLVKVDEEPGSANCHLYCSPTCAPEDLAHAGAFSDARVLFDHGRAAKVSTDCAVPQRQARDFFWRPIRKYSIYGVSR